MNPVAARTRPDPAGDPVSDQILQPDKEGQLSFTGLIFSPDGSRLYLANVAGSIKVFSVNAARQIAGLFTMPLPQANAPGRKAEIPAGLAISPDGKRLYVALNLSNKLAELDFDLCLFGHGEPLLHGASQAVRRLASSASLSETPRRRNERHTWP